MKDVKFAGREKLAAVFSSVQPLAMQFFTMLVAFVLSRGTVFGSLMPFGIAAAAAMPPDYTLAAGVGAAVGYLLPMSSADPFRYIAAVFAAAAIKWVLARFSKVTKSAGFASFIAFAAALATGLAVASMNGFETTGLVTCMAEAALAAGTAYFINRTFSLTQKTRGIRTYSNQELSCLVISICIFLISLAPYTIGSISPARVLAIILLLAAARYGHEVGGAIAGAAAGFSMSLATPEMGFITVAYSFGGLISGIFSRLGRFGCAASFILATGIIAISNGMSPEVMSALYETMAATVIFMVLPKRIGIRLSEIFSPPADMPRADGLREAVVSKLRFASSALADVCKTVEEVSARLTDINAPRFDEVFEKVESEACSHCNLQVYCWETDKKETIDGIMEMTKQIRKGGSMVDVSFSEEMDKRCPRKTQVKESLYKHFTEYNSREAAMNRVGEVRSVVTDQFDGISDMLYDMAEEFELEERFDTDAAEKIDAVLKGMGIIPEDIACCIDKYGRMSVNVRVIGSEEGKISRMELMEELSEICDRDFDAPCISKAGKDTLITISERTTLTVEYGAAQHTCGQSLMCGDAYDAFSDGKGRYIMIISDGMGSGGRAAVDGAMASGLMARLIRAGFGFDASLKIVNAAMLFKSTDESLATIDISCIDLYTGRCELLKAGAAPTILRRNGKTGKAERSSLPAGILRDVTFDKAMITMDKGDIILMLSDGASCAGTDWICTELEAWDDGDAQQLAEHIANGARRRRSDGREDDITVLAAVLKKAV